MSDREERITTNFNNAMAKLDENEQKAVAEYIKLQFEKAAKKEKLDRHNAKVESDWEAKQRDYQSFDGQRINW